MIKRFIFLPALISLFLISSCYTDDTSGNVDIPLPFGSFSDFFDQNKAQADTFFFDANNNSSVVSSMGIQFDIPSNAFSGGGNAALEVKEAVNKSDYVFLNLPTKDGSSIVSSNGAVFYKPMKNGEELNIENHLSLNIPLPANASQTDESNYFYFENDWNVDTNVELTEANDKISFESNRAAWQMTGKTLINANSSQLNVNPVGYGIIPNDMMVFVVFKNENAVISLTSNVDEVTATGQIPTGTEVDVVVMIMDFYNLRIGIQSVTIDADTDVQIAMEEVTPSGMIDKIKELD